MPAQVVKNFLLDQLRLATYHKVKCWEACRAIETAIDYDIDSLQDFTDNLAVGVDDDLPKDAMPDTVTLDDVDLLLDTYPDPNG